MDELGCLVVVFYTALLIAVGYAIGVTGPSAMDVYQDKTALEYTIINGVKVDSCVVWKDKK